MGQRAKLLDGPSPCIEEGIEKVGEVEGVPSTYFRDCLAGGIQRASKICPPHGSANAYKLMHTKQKDLQMNSLNVSALRRQN